jgi:hypothetical protein
MFYSFFRGVRVLKCLCCEKELAVWVLVAVCITRVFRCGLSMTNNGFSLNPVHLFHVQFSLGRRLQDFYS